MRAVLAVLVAAVAAVHPVCARAGEVLVFAAASLSDALEALAPACAASTGAMPRFSVGASSDLARQIRAGAPADVFFSADAARMDALQQAGLVRAAERRDVLSNQLVVVVPRGAGRPMTGAADLVGLGRVALADPEAVPAGVYAREWLTRAGVWDRVQSHVVPTVDVRAALAAVAGGHVDAGIVYRTDAAVARDVEVAYAVPRGDAPRITYVVARVAASTTPAALPMVDCLAGPEAAKVYERFGFVVLAGR